MANEVNVKDLAIAVSKDTVSGKAIVGFDPTTGEPCAFDASMIFSGDPMHHIYEACGAIWNADTGYWELNGLTDITNEQMRIIWRCSFDYSPTGPLSFRFAYSKCRTNFMVGQQYECFENRFLPRWLPQPAPDMLLYAHGFEVLRISSDYEDGTYGLPVEDARSMFAYARKLHTVLGTVILANATLTNDIFRECNALTNVKVYGLKDSISFAESPNLSNESILYMLEKCNPPAPIAITLHPEALERALADYDIMDWLERLGNVIIVSA